MKNILLLFFLNLTLIGSNIQDIGAQSNSKIIDVEWLSKHKNDADLVILHIAPLKSEYTREHIEGARFLWSGYLSNSTPDANSVPLPVASMRKSLQKLGISNQSKIVLSFMNGNLILTCRMYMILDYLGLGNQTYILNGGADAWKNAGNKLTSEIPIFKKGKFIPNLKTDLFVDTTWILNNLKNPEIVLLDARPANFYEGKAGSPRAGHIPGALNIPAAKLFEESTSTFLATDKLQELFNKPEISKSKQLVSYCFVGNAASSVYFIARELGYKIHLYDGSMEEWANHFNLPIEKVE